MKSDKYNERQPNSDTREEFLIVIDYLLNFAYDEEHASNQVEIASYAEKKYNKYIRRDRIGEILIHLEQLSLDKAYSLPFKLKSKQLNKIKRFYISQRQFDDKTIIDLLVSVKRNTLFTSKQIDNLSNKFLNISSPEEFKKKYLKKADKYIKGTRITSSIYGNRELFMEALNNLDRVKFGLINLDKALYSDTSILNKSLFNKDYEYGYAYLLYTLKGEAMPVIYMEQHKVALITHFNNLRFEGKPIERWDDEQKIKFSLSTNQTIEEWLEDLNQGKGGVVNKYKLLINLDDPSIQEFKNKFEEDWKKPFTYKTNEDNNNQAIFEVETNERYFSKWYQKNYVIDHVTILEPSYLNDFYLLNKIRTYTERLNKYGKNHTVDITINSK